MRVLLLSDLHANWPALLALQRAEPRPDAVLFAGDAVGFGADPAPCVRWLRANAYAAVQGDHDAALLPHGQPPTAPEELADAARETLDWTRRQLAPADRDALGQWPLTAAVSLGGARFYLCHGTPADPLHGQLQAATAAETELRALFAGIAADVIVIGHTHLPALRQLDGRLIVNPGSLGQPRCGLPDATYAVWENGRTQIRHLHYDHDLAAGRLRLAPLSPEVLDDLTAILEAGLLPA
jgi:putative phosphoesterase